MTPKFLSRGVLTEETSPDWVLSQPIAGDPHHPPSQERLDGTDVLGYLKLPKVKGSTRREEEPKKE